MFSCEFSEIFRNSFFAIQVYTKWWLRTSILSSIVCHILSKTWEESWKIFQNVYKQKQPPEVCCKKRYSAKFLKFYKKTTVLESLINKAEDLQACNFIKKRLQHRFFTVNMIHADIGCSKKLSLRGLLSTQCQSISKMEVFPKILHLMKPLTFSPRSSI